MSTENNYRDCTALKQNLQERLPIYVHGTAILLLLTVSVILLWAAVVKIELVVRARGEVRPLSEPTRVFNTVSNQMYSMGIGAQIAAINFQVGDHVCKGDVLIRLDTERLDSSIVALGYTVSSGEAELARLGEFRRHQNEEYLAAKSKAEAELAGAVKDVGLQTERRASDIRLAKVELQSAETEVSQIQRLVDRGVASPLELSRAQTKVRVAQEKLIRVQVLLNETRIEVLEHTLELLEKEYALKQEQLLLDRQKRLSEIQTARSELANLKLELGHMVIQAPVTGIITSGSVKVGDVVQSGKLVVTIAEDVGFRFDVSVSSEDVIYLGTGKRARVKLDAYDYREFGSVPGDIEYIAPDSDKPNISNKTESSAPAHYTVRITLDRDNMQRGGKHRRIKLGMTGQAEMVVGQERILTLLFRNIRHAISLG